MVFLLKSSFHIKLSQLLLHRHILQLHIHRQAVFVFRVVLTRNQRIQILFAFVGDAKAIFADEVAGHEFFDVGNFG